ncbi:MAG: hypothetical protein ABH880_00865 [Patescibacteria group bacterium]
MDILLYRARFNWEEGHPPNTTDVATLEIPHPKIAGKRIGFLPNMGHVLLWDEGCEEIISKHERSLRPRGTIYIALDDEGLYDGWYDAENVDNVFRMFRDYMTNRGKKFKQGLSGLKGLWIAQ